MILGISPKKRRSTASKRIPTSGLFFKIPLNLLDFIRVKKRTTSDTIVSLILVTHNDEDIIATRIKEIKKSLARLGTNYEIIIIDNNSTDQTVEILKKNRTLMKHLRILILSKSYDEQIAFSAGLDNCIGDFAFLFNIYTDPPELLQKFMQFLSQGNDIVLGKTNAQVVRYTGVSKMLLSLIAKISRHGYDYGQPAMIAMTRRAVNSIIRTRRKSRNFSYIHSLIGFKKATVLYRPIRKYKRKIKQLNFLELCLAILDTSISNSFRPLRIVCLIGMSFSLLFLLYVLLITILVVIFGLKHLAPQGWITVSTVLGTMFFLIFSFLGIISEYIIRILGETRDEPFYFISEEINQSVILPKKKRVLNIV